MKWNLRLLPNKEQAQAAQELKILEEDILAARSFIRKNHQHFFQNRSKVPIYLILGPSRFGKTTILSQSGLDLINVNNQRLNNVTPTKYCSFWFTKEALYIDTAGTYTKPDITRPRNDLIWQGFIKLLQKYFGKNSISGTLLILDLPAVTEDKNLLKKTLFCIRERIYETATLVKNIHAHIVFTKCDRIAGFTEFFSLLDAEERAQPFGIAFPRDKKVDLIADFEVKFNKLLKNLNNRIVENLQRAIRHHERALIKMFPSELDHLRQTLIEVIEKVPNSNEITLSGLYFTSSIQDGSTVDPIKNTLLHLLNLKEKPAYNLEASDNRSYFIEEIFKKTISVPPKTKKTKLLHLDFSWRHAIQAKYVYASVVAGLIIGASATTGYQSYRKNVELITQTGISLQTQNADEPENLYTIVEKLKKDSASIWLTLGINKVKGLYKFLAKSHCQLFTQNLASQIESYLNKSLSQPAIDNQKLYHTLQVYLMLNSPEKLDHTYVKNWFNNYWDEINTARAQKTALLQQLNTILQHKFSVDLNEQVIANTRENLNNLSPEQLVYLLLENSYLDQNINISQAKSISKMYTKENFHKIFDNSIPNLVNNFPKHDWVLGDLKPTTKPTVNDTIIKYVKEIYVEKYVAAWESILQPEKNLEFKDLTEAAKYLDLIATPQNENDTLVTLLKKIKQNLTIDNPPPQLTKEIKTKLKNLDTSDIKTLQNHLTKTAKYINTIAQNQNPNNASFNELTKYLQNKAATNPLVALKVFANTQSPLLQTYLLSIVADTWQVLFDAAYNHINQAWNRLIIPKYKMTLENKYPLSKDSKDDITLEDFHNFFGPHGIIDNFFNQYLDLLVNTDKTNWTWKSIDGQQLTFSPTFLEVFLRAALIQKMFYTTKAETPKLEFTLTPEDIAPGTQSFTLSIDGQKVSFSQENKKAQTLAWPGPQPGSVTMSFVNTQGKYFTISEFGSWAWFKILDKANVTSSTNTRNFELTFDLNGNAVKYTLATTEPVNPFIPEIINNFRCQEQEK